MHFVNAHNKQTLKKIIGPYQKLGIKFAMIADADVIRDKREFSDILQVTSDEQLKSQILQEREIIMKHFQVRNKYAVLYELQAKTKELAEQPLIPETADPDDIASALFDFRSNLKSSEMIRMSCLNLKSMDVLHCQVNFNQTLITFGNAVPVKDYLL